MENLDRVVSMTNNQLSDEQIVFLHNFVGTGVTVNSDTLINDYLRDYFERFASNREAVMDRAIEKGYRRFDLFVSEDGKGFGMYVRRDWINKEKITPLDRNEVLGKGPTRFHALVNALMEAEK